MRLLVVEKDTKLNYLISGILLREGFRVDSFAHLSDAVEAVSQVKAYRLAVLDAEPVSDRNIALISEIRRKTPDTTILVTAAYSSLGNRIRILDAGADALLIKPFSAAEMAAHCRALMRRAENSVPEISLQAGNVKVDPSTSEVFVGDTRVHFTKREVDLLSQLIRRFDRVVTKTNLLDTLFAYSDRTSSNAIEAIVSRLRRRLGAAGASVEIRTEHGLGYVLSDSAFAASCAYPRVKSGRH